MSSVTDTEVGSWGERVERRVGRTREFVAETEPEALAVVGLSMGALLAAFAGFLLASPWAAVPFAAFLASTGYGWIRYQALTARAITFAMTTVTLVTLGLIVVFIFLEAIPAFRYESATVFGVSVPGLGMFTQTRWSPTSEPVRYSLLPMIHGTVMVTTIATLVAAPLGVAAALFIAEIAPPTVRELVKPGIEILAGIPSIVYGFIGFTIINPWASDEFALNGGSTYLFVGLVVGLMALPTVVSVAEDALTSVPDSMKDGSVALGATDWQSMTSITLPAAFSGVSAAVLLGVGRAIGETMAATVMLAGIQRIPEPITNVFYGYETLTSLIAANYGHANNVFESALFAAGVVLFVTVLCLSIASQYIEARMRRRLGGVE
ncbi:phosphate ABC transporter permease subunit PstC [Halopiger xanaduensis]|uniref:Phosphate transport system permease protein n=1 Tax=Halopiger xanaduensis (strain DSM 18323 / JCM 14033 / SH-6) TaxID=797210 RepID=F8D9N7_HALXS|nr:phosphate ABC transporter permease subunit PstC [Halopiger xanaduensis]AEH37428.1 phosphate ABC transporter, inner membrane subunit PstC [Halopiger xanaduensis SH-6]